MEHTGWTPREKPYDLRERLLLFACLIVRLTQFLHTCGPIATALSDQMLKSGVSAGANYEEADDGSSAAHTRAKRRIVLRELKETAFPFACFDEWNTSRKYMTQSSKRRES